MKIDLTMTTALRPEVLEKTLRSIHENLVWDGGFDLIINLALVGGRGRYTEQDIRELAGLYFPGYTMRVKEISSSTDGLQWTWRQAQSDFILQ